MVGMLRLPAIEAIRGAVRYGYPVPVWLDSDPYRQRTYRYETPSDEPSKDVIVAKGGFCVPIGMDMLTPWSLGYKPLTGQALWKYKQEQVRRERSLRVRFRKWWRAHWWPAIIEDLRADLYDDWED